MTVRTQTRYPGTVVSDDSNGGTVAWADPDKAKVEDNDPATATGPGISEWLKCAGYAFNLPSTAMPSVAFLLPRRRAQGGLATITVVGTEVASSDSLGAGIVCSVPSGTTAGDVMIAVVYATTDGAHTTHDGWALVGTISSSFNSQRLSVYRRVATASEPASYSFVLANSNNRRAAITTYRGVDNDSPLASGVSSSALGANGTNHTVAQVTTSVAGARLIAAYGFNAAPGTVGTPSGMTSRAVTSGNRMVTFDETRASAAATGSRTATSTNSVDSTRIMFALRPAPLSVTDSAARLVVDATIGAEDAASSVQWAESYQTDELGPLSLEGVAAADVNSTDDFGCALSVNLGDGATVADVDALPMRVQYDVAVDVTVTSPTSEITSPAATLEWDAEVGGVPVTQASYRVEGRLQPSNTLVYDSGTITTATQQHQIGSGSPALPWVNPQNGQVVRWTVTVTEDGTADPDGVGPAISGSGSADLENDWTPPPAPTGFTVVAVLEEEDES